MTSTVQSLRGFSPRWLFGLLVLAVLPLAGCNDGGECDTCSTDEDCQAPWVCANFPEDGSQRCASGTGATSCRVR